MVNELPPAADIAGRTVWFHRCGTQQPTPGGVLLLPSGDDDAAQREALANLLQETGIVIGSPAADRHYWLDRTVLHDDTDLPVPGEPSLSPMQWVLRELLPALRNLLPHSPEETALPIAIVGCGSGGAGALNLAYRHVRQFRIVAGIGADLDFHRRWQVSPALRELFTSEEAARQQTPLLHLHPLNWPPHQFFACDTSDVIAFEGTERMLSKLGSMGIPSESTITAAEAAAAAISPTNLPESLRDFLLSSFESCRSRME